jgi:hypothetical protein
MNAEQFQLQLNALSNEAMKETPLVVLLSIFHMKCREMEDRLIDQARNQPQIVGVMKMPSQMRKQTND